MDDPLSAVDSHVGKLLMSEAIVDFLGNRSTATRILVTNQLQLLGDTDVDQIVVLKGGSMVQCGSYVQLATSSGVFSEMLQAVEQQQLQQGQDRQQQFTGPTNATEETIPREYRASEIAGTHSSNPQKGSGRANTPRPGLGLGAAAEGSQKGAVSLATFKSYAFTGARGSWVRFNILMGGFVLAECCFVTIDSWLSVWADDRLHSRPGLYITVYAALTVFYFAITLIRSIGVAHFGVASSQTLYAAMQTHCLYCPMRLFDTVPMGRL
eukprot:COSAG02_NODE_18973_length_907_cov_1.180693_1_plen_266_part_10